MRALAEARSNLEFRAYVCDSSTTESKRRQAAEVCEKFEFATYHPHTRIGYAAARNELTRVGDAPLLVSVDDDVYVEPDAIERLLERYRAGSGWRIVAGSVAWGDEWFGPVVMRRIGYGRHGAPDEPASFFVTALILYPRTIAEQFPFNERIRASDDRFMGALWRTKQVAMLFEPSARAIHDDDHNFGLRAAEHQDSHIYTNLYDAFFARRQWTWALAFEVLGFLAGAKLYFRALDTGWTFLRAWVSGHIRLVRDWRLLREQAARPFAGMPPEV